MTTITRKSYARAILAMLGGAQSDEAVIALVAQMRREGTAAAWNPLATTQWAPGATDFNSVHVRNYPDYTTGVRATVQTLLNGYYDTYVDGLRSPDKTAEQIVGDASDELDTWGSGGVATLGLVGFTRNNFANFARIVIGDDGAADAPPSPVDDPRPLLREGASGDAVVTVQKALNAAGASPALDEDGAFGPLTDAAVKDFQARSGLDVDGIVGPATWAALDGPPPARAPIPWDPGAYADLPELRVHTASNAVGFLQEVLYHAGYGYSVGDNRFGPQTQRGVRDFQASKNGALAVDGIVGPRTWSALAETIGADKFAELRATFGV